MNLDFFFWMTYGGVWFVILNNYFPFLINISRISMHFFTHTYFQKYFQTTIFLKICKHREYNKKIQSYGKFIIIHFQ